jgi:hypothetical protein
MTPFNRIQIKRFGEDVEFQTTIPLTLKAIVETESKSEHVAQTQISNQNLILNVLQSDVANKGIERHQIVSVRGKNYKIIEIGEDLDGFAQFKVSRT